MLRKIQDQYKTYQKASSINLQNYVNVIQYNIDFLYKTIKEEWRCMNIHHGQKKS